MLKDTLVHALMPVIRLRLKFRYKVICEPHSIIYPSCRFEGGNRICRNSYVSRCRLGYGSYLGKNCNIVSADIGRYTCVGPYVRTTSGVHPIDFVSIHPAFYSRRKQTGFTYVTKQKFNEKMDENYHTIIGNDVWIGDSALLIEGVNIGNGAVIAAGTVVTKDVPPYAIVAGVPAKIIRYRFPEEQISILETIRWWDKDKEWLKAHVDDFTDIHHFMNMNKSEGENER